MTNRDFTEHPPHRHCECAECVEYFKPEQPDLDAICQDLQEMTYNQAMRIAELEEKLKLALEALEVIYDRAVFDYSLPADHFAAEGAQEAITAIKAVLSAKYSDIVSDGGLDPRNTIKEDL